MKVEAKAHGELVQVVEELRNEVQDSRKSMTDKHEALEKMQNELMDQLKKQERRALFPEAMTDALDGSAGTFKKYILDRRPREGSGHADLIEEIQRANDAAMVVERIRQTCKKNKIDGTPDSLWETQTGQEYKKLVDVFKAAQDIDFDTTESADWIPTDLSQNLREWIAIEMRVASLFNEFTMPTPTFDWPYVTGPPDAQYVPEVDELAQAFTGGTLTTAAAQMFGGSDPAAKNTFVARKVRAYSFYSREWREDTIRATLPWLMRQLPLALGRATEGATINGAETSIDTAYAGANHAYRWFDGLRQYVISEVGTWVGDTTDTHAHRFADGMGGTWDITKFADELRKQRKKMDKYGLRLGELVYIVDINAYYQLMSLPNFQTLDKLGRMATLLTGQVGSFDNIPVVVSEFMHLVEAANATPANNGTILTGGNTEDSGSIILVWRPGWIYGRRPGVGVEVDRFPFTDQYGVVIHDRRDFGPLEPSGTGGALTVNFGDDIPVF